MALPKDYSGLGCSLSRSLEVLGERWTLLIIRDAFHGVRRFSDFAQHLSMSRAVLSDRLAGLVEHGVLVKKPAGGYAEYELTAKGKELWPVVLGLTHWGDKHYASGGAPEVFEHTEDDGRLDGVGVCESCGHQVDAEEVRATPRRIDFRSNSENAISKALTRRHRLLQPLKNG
ncbi:winged helix-turn-helix transcriptional regulator [Streptomyces liangshanensis]|uniref:Helix-turn-helix transcriptional regulator n=1 Tax=Streptomyces liangshanensis TaxID=2717324 RepID=A0A6G9H567_9ACTN|nr:helix-turn-helix domain-containing protein [Streptomyces liangshanensis]QIQ05672.1 helix-turn-helix transcriptional regulator [Streptomyces liangshanensis]